MWAIKWHSKNKLDGETIYFVKNGTLPYLFDTRQEARDVIKTKFGYIKDSPDLRREPYEWRMPRAVKVRVTIEEHEG